MKFETLDIELGKSYSASQLLEKVNGNQRLEFQFGHIVVEYETEKRHKYFINMDYIKKLKETNVKVYTIISRSSNKNFANKLLQQNDIKEILESVDKNHSLCCLITDEELKTANNNAVISTRKATMMINKVFKLNKMDFKASKHPEGIKIMYKKLKEIKGEEIK